MKTQRASLPPAVIQIDSRTAVENLEFITVGDRNDAGISGVVAGALDIARRASGRDNE